VAALAASAARRSPGFDPATSLGIAVPMIVLGPLFVFAMLTLGVRGRRASANLAIGGPLLALAGVVLAAWARFGKTDPFDATYEWLNIATAFNGPSQFQTYIATVGIRITHLTAVLMLAVIGISFGILAWSRSGARREPSAARYYGLLTLLLAAALGVIASTDLIELYAFWGVAGIATYLLLSNHWSDAESTLAARVALGLPALTDLALLAGIAVLYSRYGQLNIDQLIPQLGITPGAGPKALALAGVLMVAGAAGRLALFPFHSWVTGTQNSPAGALAAAQAFWPVMVAALLYKVMPVIVSSNGVPLRAIAWTAAVSAVAVPLLALVTDDIRRMVAAAGIGITAAAFLAFVHPGLVGPAALALAAVGLARAALVLTTGSLVSGLRTPLLSQMGEGLRRMRLSALAIPLAVAGLVLGLGQVAGGGLRWYWLLAYALAVLLGSTFALRVYFGAAHGPLPRRRGFDPNRVRAASTGMAYAPLVLALLALLLGVGMFSNRWLYFVDHRLHQHPPIAASVGWIALALAGAGLAAVVFLLRRDLGRALIDTASGIWRPLAGGGRAITDRLLVRPLLQLAGAADEGGLAAGEAALGAAFEAGSQSLRGVARQRFRR